MPTREQITHERLEALIEVLVEQGTLSRDWADSLESTRQLGDASKVAKAAAENGDPPEPSNAGGRQ